MKKLLKMSTSKSLIFCLVGLMINIGAYWHHQTYQHQLERAMLVTQGIGTCFNRITQTFTAMMIKDLQSAYLGRGFVDLTEECLGETLKSIRPIQKYVPKEHQALKSLMADTHWFHESILRKNTLGIKAGVKDNASPLSPVVAKFSQIEGLKVNFVDGIENHIARIRKIQVNDEILMGVGLLFFVIGMSFISLNEFRRKQLQRDIENQALNYLNAGKANIGAIVDQLVERGLKSHELVVLAQIFKDYHGELLEKMAPRPKSNQQDYIGPKKITAKSVEEGNKENLPLNTEKQNSEILQTPKVSFKEILVSIQKINDKDSIHAKDVRDVLLAVEFESFEQIMNAAINKLVSRRADDQKIIISNQIHSDRAIINLFLAGSIFTAGELSFAQDGVQVPGDAIDMNMIILKEMTKEAKMNWYIENKTDRSGNMIGMVIRFSVDRFTKDAKSSKNLVSVFKGKKKDFGREVVN